MSEQTKLEQDVEFLTIERNNLLRARKDQDRQYYRELVKAAIATKGLAPKEVALWACDIADAVLAEVKRREKKDE